jgi:hypothetical protein
LLLALAFALGVAEPAKAADYAGAISAYRRAHRWLLDFPACAGNDIGAMMQPSAPLAFAR